MIDINNKLAGQLITQLWFKLKIESNESSFQFYSPINIQLFNKLYLVLHDQLVNYPKWLI
jgi:hypothetical protein